MSQPPPHRASRASVDAAPPTPPGHEDGAAGGAGVASGLALIVALTAAAYAAARLPGAGLLGPLVLAMLLGMAWRALVPAGRDAVAPGARFAARHLLRLGIVLLGVRLDVRSLVDLGPTVLIGSALGALAAFAVVEALGRAWRVPVDLRRAVGIGTAICGASAIAAALPVLRARERHASVSIAAISLLGTAGVVAFASLDALAGASGALLGLLAGATLQEVGQVVAAGGAMAAEDADLALLVKLSRVVLLAPALVLLGWWGRFGAPGAPARRAAAPIVPGFVVGFLGLGFAASLGWLPAAAVAVMTVAGTLLTAAAMTGIGLGVDVRAVRGAGGQALALAAAGFVALFAVMSAYYLLAPGIAR